MNTVTNWPRSIAANEWCMSENLLSLNGTKVFESLPVERRQRLSLFEAANFFSLNINGEKALIEGVARRLHRPQHADISLYLHHFLEEENRHMQWFANFCNRYAGKIYPDRKFALEREYEQGEEDLLFFLRIVIFEEIVDSFNSRMSKDESLCSISREINARHHKDETHHLAFGRKVVSRLWSRHHRDWSSETVENVREYAHSYVDATWREYYNPDVYEDASLSECYELAALAWKSDHARQLRAEVSAPIFKFLEDVGI